MIKRIIFFVIICIIYKEVRGVNKKNVLFIVLDDFRPVIGGYGDHKAHTPNIDKLMTNSHYFTNVFAQQALCAPSRNSMLTGRRPDTLHLYDFFNYWRTFVGNFTTLPQYLKDNGYYTASIGKIFHPGITSNFTDDYPYSWSQPSYHPSTEAFMNAPVCLDNESGRLVRNILCPVDVQTQPEQTLPDIQSILQAKNFLRNSSVAKEPFFLAVGLHKPHIPFKFPNKYLKFHPIDKFNDSDGFYKPYGMPNVAWNPFNDIRDRYDVEKLNVSFPFGPIPKEFQSKLRQNYYAAVTYVDDLIGQLLESVDLKETIIVLTSDHGWSLGEHAEWAKYGNFDVTLRVPLIIYSPNHLVSRKNEIRNIGELVDIFPTIVDLLNLKEIPKCPKTATDNEILCTEGKSLLPYLTNNNSTLNDGHYFAFSQYPRPNDYPTIWPDSDRPRLEQIKIMGYTIRTNRFRYTLWVKFRPKKFTKNWKDIYGEELYDHALDNGENMNLADRDQLADIKHYLKKLLTKQFQ